MILRLYQIDAIHRLRALIAAGRRRLILQAATGAGKTVMAAEIIRRGVAKGSRVLFLAHRRELIRQAADKLIDFGVSPGIIMRGEVGDSWLPVQVASRDTLLARAIRSTRVKLPPADIVIPDECHRTMSTGYRRILDAYPRAVVVGLTATPVRGDGLGLGDYFEGMVQTVPVSQLIAEGHLVSCRIFAPHVPDMSGVKISNGEWTEGGSASVMDRPSLVGDAVRHWLEHARGKQTVVFGTRVTHSIHLCQRFKAAGVQAEHIDGEMDTAARDEILARFKRREVQVVCNVDVLTEGYDCPQIEVLVDCQPCRSLRKTLQKWGRIMRPCEGKTHALILDHAGNVLRHGYPDEDREWTLTTTERMEEREQREREEGRRKEPFACPRCAAVYSGRICPECGYEPPQRRGREAENEEAGKLIELTSRPKITRDEKVEYWRRCVAIAANTGKRVGAAAHMYRQKFGVWPRGVDPQPRGDEWKQKASELYPQFCRRPSCP